MDFKHVSVLLKETVDSIFPERDGIYVDGTAGGGGHSYEILKRLNNKSRLICFDKDETAVKVCKERFKEYGSKVTVIQTDFKNIKNELKKIGIEKIDGFIADLGVSSYQLDTADRGFSYMHDAPLDMRMDESVALTAKDIINKYSIDALERIFFDYGEERYSKRIARRIDEVRKNEEIKSTLKLVDIIRSALPSVALREKQHPAKRCFQAIRIEVNGELDNLKLLLADLPDLLNLNGRIGIITFHSLEDRIVKQFFAEMSLTCVCPKEFPVCICHTVPKLKVITRKPIIPSDSECGDNSRARSAKLRIAEKI